MRFVRPFEKLRSVLGKSSLRVAEDISAEISFSELPVIVSLEIHANLQQQQMLIDIMHEEWAGIVVLPPLSPSEAILPRPGELRGKILVKVKYTAPQDVKQQKAEGDRASRDTVASTGNASDSPSDDDSEYARKPKQKKPKLLDSLSALGVYMRGYHFKGFDKPGRFNSEDNSRHIAYVHCRS